MIQWIKGLTALMGRVKSLITAIFLFVIGIGTVYNTVNNNVASFGSNLSDFSDKTYSATLVLRDLKDRYSCDNVEVYAVHNGKVVAGNIHDMKISKLWEANTSRKMNTTMRPIRDVSLSPLIEEYYHTKEYGELIIDKSDRSYIKDTTVQSIVHAFGINTIIFIPLYKEQGFIDKLSKDDNNPIAFLTYEYENDTILYEMTLNSMKLDKILIENILNE